MVTEDLCRAGIAGRLKGIKNRLQAVANIGQATTIAERHGFRFLFGERPARAQQAFAAHDRPQQLDRILQLVVDQNVVVSVVILDFAASP